MESNFLTVDQVAKKLDLHPKTIRNLIQSGKLNARKIGKQWRITEADLLEIAGVKETNQVESFRNTGPAVNDKDSKPSGQKIHISTVIDIHVESIDEAVRITNSIFALLNCKDPSYGDSRCDHVFFKDEMKARYILWGNPKFITDMLDCIKTICGSKED